MKHILFVIFTSISITSSGQDWIQYKADSTLSILLPQNYTVVDTMGQRVVSAQIDNGLIMVSMLSNTGEIAMNIDNEKHLIKSYHGFRDGYIKSQHGQLIKDEIIERSGLKLIRFSYKVTLQTEHQLRHCIGVFVREKMYSIAFIEMESMTREMTPFREKLFSSLTFSPNHGLEDQLTNKGSAEKGYKLGKLLGQITVGALIGGIIFWTSRRRKKKEIKG